LLQRHHAFQRIFEGGALHRTPAFDYRSFDVNYSESADTLQKVRNAGNRRASLFGGLVYLHVCQGAQRVVFCACLSRDARPVFGASARVSRLGPVFVRRSCRNVSRADFCLRLLRELKLCLKVQDRHSSAPSARSWCFQMSHRRGDPELPYDQQCHGFVQVVKRLTAMASHEESDLFDLYSKVSCLVESY
jgi:hypothetical protein